MPVKQNDVKSCPAQRYKRRSDQVLLSRSANNNQDEKPSLSFKSPMSETQIFEILNAATPTKQ